MKKITLIQVLLTGDSTCELEGELVKIDHQSTGTYITIREENSDKHTSYFPHAQIRMIRIWDEKA